MPKSLLPFFLVFGSVIPAFAQPVGWDSVLPIVVTEQSETTLSGYQLRMVIDTSAMAPGAADLRFGADEAGSQLLDYWIESGAGTASTAVWVKLPTLPASESLKVYMFSGNSLALSASTVNVFDFTNTSANSATNQVSGGSTGGVGNSQRGFRFSPLQDVLLTDFGKNEPSGTARYVTLFDASSQAILVQTVVSGPATSYSYQAVPQPMWLRAGTEYVLQIYQDASDGYYFSSTGQLNPLLQYFDMPYCNNCTKDTFPTSALNNLLYGYVDFLFRTRQLVTTEPAYLLNAFIVSADVNPVGTGTVACTSPVALNASSTCTANPATGYRLAGFGGDCTGMTCDLVNIQADKSVAANFVPLEFTIAGSVSPNGSGVISCVSPVNYGQTATCTATANPGHVFAGFTGDCTGMSCSLTDVQSDKEVIANFNALSPLAPQAIPSLSEWSLLFLGLLIAAGSARRIRSLKR
ncbi:MAG: IPTL-CTERM sorting domain-containing protein [Comamonadaceae bacterium]|nr:IPTL-CTERM sorting domain-containing protein [Comamonadaceae bacterium]